MSKTRRIISVIIIVIVAFCALSLGYHFTRPSVNVVLSEAELPLLEDRLPAGFYEPYRVIVTCYPETAAADYTLYSPVAGVLASVNDNIAEGAAVWGLETVPEGFATSFTPSEERRWQSAYEAGLSVLPSAAVCNSASSSELQLVDGRPEETLVFSYDGSLSRVSADELKRQLEAESVGLLYVYSPENVLNLLTGGDGFTLVVPLLYGKAFEDDDDVTLYLAAEDFITMFSHLSEEGAVETPYTVISADKGLKAMLDKLL